MESVVILEVDRTGGDVMNDYDCENMTAFGCPARDAAKSLMLQEMIEGSYDYRELQDICKKQCCKDCDESCGYRCGQAY